MGCTWPNLSIQYEAEYNGCKNCEDSYQQFLQVYGRMRSLNGLYYHAYDDSRQMFWCDKVTGLSENFWLRAMGWYAMALIDTMEVMPESMACQKARLNAIYKELIDAMLPYQDQATGMVPGGEPGRNCSQLPGGIRFRHICPMPS